MRLYAEYLPDAVTTLIYRYSNESMKKNCADVIYSGILVDEFRELCFRHSTKLGCLYGPILE